MLGEKWNILAVAEVHTWVVQSVVHASLTKLLGWPCRFYSRVFWRGILWYSNVSLFKIFCFYFHFYVLYYASWNLLCSFFTGHSKFLWTILIHFNLSCLCFLSSNYCLNIDLVSDFRKWIHPYWRHKSHFNSLDFFIYHRWEKWVWCQVVQHFQYKVYCGNIMQGISQSFQTSKKMFVLK